ncbi:MAG TPA: hypothetical protein VH877_30695 [Polyangia bacterium]|jgi:hypothetical protein|nr:hypothetical protein [Polyangia bacterium]
MKEHVLKTCMLVLLGGTALIACSPSEDLSVESLSQGISYTDVGSIVGTAVSNGYTCGAANEVTPSCAAGSTASDLNYSWTAPYTGRYTITATGSRFNPVLVVTNVATGAVLACANSGSTASSATVSLSAGQKVYLTVDGNASDCGSFQLTINYATCGVCTPRSGCYDSDCVHGLCQQIYACTPNQYCSSGTCTCRLGYTC